MASYNVVSAKTATLVGSTADTITFSRAGDRVYLVNAGAGTISMTYASPGGSLTAATVDGDNTISVPVGTFVYPPVGNISVGSVSLISSGTPKYCVMASD
jgi:hypothetical protein